MTVAIKRFQPILLATGIAMILHTVEEYFTQLYYADPFIVSFSRYFNLNPAVTYLTLQILILCLIFVLLAQSFHRGPNKFLAILLGLVFFLELLHPYNSIRVQGYYSGLYSGVILVIIGVFYWKELIKEII
jgi:Protein of unknown function with HXXEE motif